MKNLSRRNLLKMSAGIAAVNGLGVYAADSDSKQQALLPAKAKSVIFLNMTGAPSHVDTFDYKPELAKQTGKRGKYGQSMLGSPFKFKQQGKSGLWISELFPELGKMADELCLLKGMYSSQPNHPQAQTLMHTGNFQFPRPSLGSWVLYGLGSQNKNIPGFISLTPPSGKSALFSSGFLPTKYQGTMIGQMSRGGRGGGSQELPNIANKYISKELQSKQVKFMQMLNQNQYKKTGMNEFKNVHDSIDMAYKMQDSMPAIMDISKEKKSVQKLYGLEESNTESFGKQCLLARRFVEAGARFIEISHGSWDHHFSMKADMTARSNEIDIPIAGLLKDLKQKGLLESTLVVWSGEFGRTPESPTKDGRGHNNKGYTSWVAGGGVRGGMSYGATDPMGYEAVDGRLSTHDWHATILRIMGIDHEKLTYNYAGRDFRLTDVYGEAATQILS
ncbi:MAG: DUF1501 domain-containing protein [Lentisphaeraceae bacterium]|nr:DUF1501 domain-containing protein [Lentisphaeraceae bacterium]